MSYSSKDMNVFSHCVFSIFSSEWLKHICLYVTVRLNMMALGFFFEIVVIIRKNKIYEKMSTFIKVVLELFIISLHLVSIYLYNSDYNHYSFMSVPTCIRYNFVITVCRNARQTMLRDNACNT